MSMYNAVAILLCLLITGVAAAATPTYDRRGYLVAPRPPVVSEGRVVGASFALVPGHFYLTDHDSNTILQADAVGTIVGSLTPAGYTQGLRGSAFGPDGRLYVIAVAPTGYDVLVITEDGSIARTLRGVVPITGNISFGNLVVDEQQNVYVAAVTLQTIPRHATFATEINNQGDFFDVDLLDNGNLVTLQAYSVTERTRSGQLVRTIASGAVITDGRGMAYNPTTQQLYVTILGTSSAFFQILRINPITGAVINQTTFAYGNSISLRSDGALVVGSRTQVPVVFTAELSPIGLIGTTNRMFVSVMNAPLFQFRDGFE